MPFVFRDNFFKTLERRQNDRWLFLGGDFGRANSDQNTSSTCPSLQRGYAIKKKYGTAKFTGPSAFGSAAGGTASSSLQARMVTPVKNHYKTLIDRLEKMKQNETVNF